MTAWPFRKRGVASGDASPLGFGRASSTSSTTARSTERLPRWRAVLAALLLAEHEGLALVGI
jgi:hypothetical protein